MSPPGVYSALEAYELPFLLLFIFAKAVYIVVLTLLFLEVIWIISEALACSFNCFFASSDRLFYLTMKGDSTVFIKVLWYDALSGLLPTESNFFGLYLMWAARVYELYTPSVKLVNLFV